MREQYQQEKQVSSIDCGSFIVSYHPSYLLRDLEDITTETANESFTLLAEPYFKTPSGDHITHAAFGVQHENDNQTAHGEISYTVSDTHASRRYHSPGVITKQLKRHLQAQLQFFSYDYTDTDEGLLLTSDDREFYIKTVSLPSEKETVTITVTDNYLTATYDEKSLVDAATLWGSICDYIIRLHAGKRAVLDLNQVSTATIGQFAEHPSDIEIATAEELSRRRQMLGKAATLPNFDSEDILSDTTQSLSENARLKSDEINLVAKYIIDKKRRDYATLDIMTSISQGDIIEALHKITSQRTDGNS